MAAGPDSHPDPKRRWVAAASCGAFYIVFAVFVVTTLIQEPASVVTLLAILAISVGLDYAWNRQRERRARAGA